MAKRNGEKIASTGIAGSKNRLDRRTLLRAGALAAGMAGIGAGVARAAESIGTDAPDWMKAPGRSFSTYGMPSKWQEKLQRIIPFPPARPRPGLPPPPLHFPYLT